MATSFFDPTYLEAVYAALFAQIQTATFAGGVTIKNYTRAMEPPDDVPTTNQPALFQVPGPLHSISKEFALPKWVCTAMLMIYLRSGSAQPVPNPLPQTLAYYLIWGIMNSLLTNLPYEKQTLGGLVYHCWIEGEVGIETASEQTTIAIPVFIDAGNVG